MNLFTYLRALVTKEEGQDMIEYALLAALIAIVAVVAIGDVGTRVNGIFQAVVAALPQM